MKDTCSHCGQEVEHTCVWCGEPAVAFCDGWIGGETEGGLFSTQLPFFSCDAPLCNEHRHPFGFVCGKNPDTLDHCPVHAQDRVTINNAAKSSAEADALRRSVWAIGRRHRMMHAARTTAVHPSPGVGSSQAPTPGG